MTLTLENYPREIRDARARNRFWRALLKDGFNFHPDTDAREYVDARTGQRCLDDRQARLINRLLEQARALDGDPYASAIRCLRTYLTTGLVSAH